MPTSPNPLNYFVGKGVLKWKGALPTIDTDYRDLGNAPLFEVTPVVTRLPHNSARKGVRFQDFNPVVSRMATLKFHLEEFTPENLTLALMGTLTAGSPNTVDIMNVSEVSGALRLVGTNDIGDKIQVDIPSVNIAPSAMVSFIGDTYGILEITGEIAGDPATGSFGTIRTPITTEIT